MTSADNLKPHEFESLRGQISNHPGEIAHRRWASLQVAHTALMANEAELLAVVRRAETDATYRSALMANKEFERDVYFHQLFRTLHNYLAMLVTLVDHSRVHMRSYAGTDFAKEQKRRNGVVRESVSGTILRDFRNYMLHVAIPPMEFTVHWNRDHPDQETFVALFKTRELLKWSNWSASSKRYLRSTDTINVGDLIDDYSQIIEDYYEWLYEQFQLLHGADIADRNRLVSEYDSFWAPRSGNDSEKQF